MISLNYTFELDNSSHLVEMVLVEGSCGRPFVFGQENASRAVELQNFFISKFPVTQAFWAHVMGANPSISQGDHKPVENVSWLNVTGADGFLNRINASNILGEIERQIPPYRVTTPSEQGLRIQSLDGQRSQDGSRVGMIESPHPKVVFRLPSETEWEYAARGGPRWAEGFRFSGSNDIDAVAWYEGNSRKRTHNLGQKMANRLGIYDMSGNVWEWCHDAFTRDVSIIPSDGSAFVGDSSDRILRGGSYHNWSVHCTVSKRYEMAQDYRDGSIGFRLVLGVS